MCCGVTAIRADVPRYRVFLWAGVCAISPQRPAIQVAFSAVCVA